MKTQMLTRGRMPALAIAAIAGLALLVAGSGAAAAPLTPAGSNDVPVAQSGVPTIQVSKTEVNASGDTITVTGTGFDPSLGIGTRPPLAGVPSGFYVTFAAFADVWKPSEGAGSGARPTIPQAEGAIKWAVLEGDRNTVGFNDSVTLNPDGTFTATLNVREYAGAIDADNYGIYTYGGSGAIQPLFETFTPITVLGLSTPEPTATATATATASATTAPATATPKPPVTGGGTLSEADGGSVLPFAGVMILAVAAGAGALFVARSPRS